MIEDILGAIFGLLGAGLIFFIGLKLSEWNKDNSGKYGSERSTQDDGEFAGCFLFIVLVIIAWQTSLS